MPILPALLQTTKVVSKRPLPVRRLNKTPLDGNSQTQGKRDTGDSVYCFWALASKARLKECLNHVFWNRLPVLNHGFRAYLACVSYEVRHGQARTRKKTFQAPANNAAMPELPKPGEMEHTIQCLQDGPLPPFGPKLLEISIGSAFEGSTGTVSTPSNSHKSAP